MNEEEIADLVAYLDGEADEKTVREVEEKLGRDASIRAEADALQRTWDLLDYLPKPEPATDFTHRTLERVSALRPRIPPPRRWRWRSGAAIVGWAAALLLAITSSYWLAKKPTMSDRGAVVEQAEIDQLLARDRRLVENYRTYEHVDDVEFLWALSDPDLFGDDS